MIAAAVVAFGPFAGAAYSWIGTMVSALVGFYLGRAAGARVLERFSGDGVKRFTRLVGQNGFLASLIVRLVPSAPFIVVNMAAGVTPMRLRDFAAGTALGIIPKIALTAFAGATHSYDTPTRSRQKVEANAAAKAETETSILSFLAQIFKER